MNKSIKSVNSPGTAELLLKVGGVTSVRARAGKRLKKFFLSFKIFVKKYGGRGGAEVPQPLHPRALSTLMRV